MSLIETFRADARHYQIVVLGGLLAYGLLVLGFDQTIPRVALLLTSMIFFQYLATRIFQLSTFEWRSAFISGLSLTILFRASDLWILILAAAVTVFSKFLLRARNKHIFNPTNLGIVAMLLLFDGAWVSPAQWGSKLLFAGFVALVGILVVNRACRSDVTIAFLFFYVGSLLMRALYLGDPLAIPFHQLQSGSLLIFAFFMISDPKTTPDSRIGRVLFAAMVCALAYYFRFKLYDPNGLLYSLVICSAFVPVIDTILRGPRFQWGKFLPSAESRFSVKPLTT